MKKILIMLVFSLVGCATNVNISISNKIADVMNNSVVRVALFDEYGRYRGYGTGWSLDDRTIITAGHVLHNASTVALLSSRESVKTDKFTSSFTGEIGGQDIGIIHLDRDYGFRPLKISKKPMKLLDELYVVGYGMGGPLHVSTVIVSGQANGIGYIVIDGNTGPGDSGSPVLNSDGEVVGVLLIGWAPGAIGGILPIETYMEWLRDLRK